MPFFVSFIAGVVFFYLFRYFPLSTIFLFLSVSAYLSHKRKLFHIFIILMGIAFVFLRYGHDKDLSHMRGKEVIAMGDFQSYPVEKESGTFTQSFYITTAVDVKNGEQLNELAGQEITVLSEREFVAGEECSLYLRLLRDHRRFNPGTYFSDEIFAQLVKVYDPGRKKISLASKTQELRGRLNRYIDAKFKRDSASFLSAITTGHRASMDERLRDAFNKSGLAHILSISGTHFGLFSVFLFGIFRFLIKHVPYKILQRMTMYLTPPQVSAMLCLPFMVAYLGLSGGSIPAVRSFIMISLFLLGLLIGRKGFWLNSILFAAFLLTLWDPNVVLDLSFQLSFLAVLFIGFSLKGIKDEEKEERKVLRYLKNIIFIALSASIGTAPLVAYHFHYLSIISPLSNLFVTPFIGFTLLPLTILSSFLFLVTGNFIFTPAVSAISDMSISLIMFLSQLPFADVKVPAFPPVIVLLFYAGFIFYFLSGRKRYTLIIPFVPILIYFSLTIFEKKELTITYLDVGQGDSSVIELPDGKTIVIDTGRSGRETASFLKYEGREAIDALIFSHIHSDHTGGLDYILKRLEVKELWDNGRLIYPENFIANIKHRTFNRGDVIVGKGYSIYVFHPYPEFYTMYGSDHVEANNDSLVLKIKGSNNSFLFTGDVEEEAEEDLIHLDMWLKSDVIKIPHQGSKTSAYKPFFELVSPRIAVISVGHDNAFGHPHKEILDALQGSRILRTDLDGAIKIRESEKGVVVKTFKDFQLEKAKSFKEEIKNIKQLFETW